MWFTAEDRVERNEREERSRAAAECYRGGSEGKGAAGYERQIVYGGERL